MKPLPTSSRLSDNTCWSWHLPRTEIRGGCRGFFGPVPPPLLMWCVCDGEYSNALKPHLHAQLRASACADRGGVGVQWADRGNGSDELDARVLRGEQPVRWWGRCRTSLDPDC